MVTGNRPLGLAMGDGLGRALMLAGLLVFGSCPGWAQGASTSHIGQLVRLPDGRRINLRCSGSGAPTVLFDGGYAADSQAWWKVQPQIAQTHRACTYDRAGYGASDAGPEPRDGAAVAKDLDQTLRAAKIAGPYVVVGHSAGALYMRLFAARRPRDVVGMVLVDPSVEHQDRRLAAVFGPGAGSLKGQHDRAVLCLAAARRGVLPSSDPSLKACGQTAAATNWQTQISEADTLWGATSNEVSAAPVARRSMPIIVLTADGTYESAPAQVRSTIEALWTGWHRELAALSRCGQEHTVAHSSHLMMIDRPDEVIAAIGNVMAERCGAKPNPSPIRTPNM